MPSSGGLGQLVKLASAGAMAAGRLQQGHGADDPIDHTQGLMGRPTDLCAGDPLEGKLDCFRQKEPQESDERFGSPRPRNSICGAPTPTTRAEPRRRGNPSQTGSTTPSGRIHHGVLVVGGADPLQFEGAVSVDAAQNLP